MSHPLGSLLGTSIQLANSGLSVIAIKPDGSKAPPFEWKRYQQTIARPDELRSWYVNGRLLGIAAVAGPVSGNLEIIDFDSADLIDPWLDLVRSQDGAELLDKLVMVRTPSGGMHFYYRCDEVQGNQKLAQKLIRGGGENGDDKVKALIETRGSGGYVLIPGCPVECHPVRRAYEFIQGDLTSIPRITPEQRALLLDCARAFNEYVQEKQSDCKRKTVGTLGDRPGDQFNRQASWREILEPHGWKHVYSKGDTSHWRRPGKNQGISATTNHQGSELLYVFSSNAAPFECERGYCKFSTYAILNHAGDFEAAARALGSNGYGAPKRTRTVPWPADDQAPREPGDDFEEVQSEASAGNDSAEKQKQQITVIESLPEFAARVSQLPKLKTYVPDLVYEDKTGLTHGQPRDGKSLFELDVALTAAIGGCVVGLERFRVSEPVSVCYLTEEDSEREVLKRITWLLVGKGVSTLPGNFFLAVRRGIDIDEFKWQRYLIGAAKERGFKFLIIDPLRAFTAHADQGPSELKPVSLFIRRFMNETGCSHRVVHHDGKPQAGKPDERKRPQRASGGGIFSISDCPLSFQRISRDKTMVVPSGYKFTDDPPPFKFTLEKNGGKETEWIRLVGENMSSSADDADLEKFEIIKEALKKQPGLSGRKVSEATGIRKDDCNTLLEKLLGLNEVDRVTKGAAKLWFLPGT